MRLIAAALEWLIFLVLFPFLLLHPRVRRDPPAPGPLRRRGGAQAGPARVAARRLRRRRARPGAIVRELKALRPDARVLVSAITDSGASMAEQQLIASGLADAVTSCLRSAWPLQARDGRAAAGRAGARVTELWPQLIRAASRAGSAGDDQRRIAPENLGRYRLLFALAATSSSASTC